MPPPWDFNLGAFIPKCIFNVNKAGVFDLQRSHGTGSLVNDTRLVLDEAYF